MNGPGAGAPPPQQQQVVVQQEQPPQKESKYGGLKQTVRISFVFRVLCFVFCVYFYFYLKSGALMCCCVSQLATSAVGGVGFGAGAFFRDCL